MKTPNPSRLRVLAGPVAVLALGAALLAAPPARAAGTFVEKTVDVPRDTKIPVDISFEKASITFVESQNDPKEKDVKEAEAVDPSDKTIVLIRFTYRNDDYYGHRVRLRVVLMDDANGVLAEGGRSATLDKGQREDTVTFPVRVKTLDWPKAKKLKILATFVN